MKLPAFQFYPADWRKDPGVQSLSFHDRGIWFEILCLMHESSDRGKLMLRGQAMPEDALARLLGLDKQNLTKALTTLIEYGVASVDPDSGALVCRRMVKDEDIRKKRAEAGKLGGNPALVPKRPRHLLKQKSTPSSSSSPSSSEGKSDDGEVEDLCSLEQALEYAPACRMSTAAVKFWYHSRKATGWRRGGAGTPKIRSWQSDMAAAVNWAEEEASKLKTNGEKKLW